MVLVPMTVHPTGVGLIWSDSAVKSRVPLNKTSVPFATPAPQTIRPKTAVKVSSRFAGEPRKAARQDLIKDFTWFFPGADCLVVASIDIVSLAGIFMGTLFFWILRVSVLSGSCFD